MTPRSQLLQGRLLQQRPARQFSAPHVPQRVLPQHFCAIKIQPLLPFLRNPCVPALALFRADFGMRPDQGAQNVEIMHLSQRVLQIAQVRSPLFMTLRKEVLHACNGTA